MKKLTALLLVALLLLAGCANGKAPAPAPTPTPTPEPTPAPTAAPTPTPAPTPAPTPEPTPEPTEAPSTSVAMVAEPEKPSQNAGQTAQLAAEPEKLPQGAEQIYARCMPAVFDIEVYDADGWDLGGGSCFFIDENGTAVTNHHVIYGAATAELSGKDAEGNDVYGEVLGAYAWSEEEDWAILKTDIRPDTWLKIGDPATVVGGATVYALGSPLGLSSTISDGLISNPARDIEGQLYIQTSAAIAPGSSGGALVNKYGEVIGITAGGFVYGENLNYAVPMTKLADVSLDEVYPLDETYVLPSGIIYPDSNSVELRRGETVASVVTALKYDTDELLTVRYEIDDEDLLSCSWEPWSEDDTEVTLNITAGETCGSTTVWIYLLTSESEELLDYDYIYVTIADGYVYTDASYYDVGFCQTVEVPISAESYSGESIKVRFEVPEEYEDLIDCHWGDWDGTRIPLYVEGLEEGDTPVSIYLLDAETDEVLAESSFYVYVVGAGFQIGEDTVFLAPGDSETVNVKAISYIPDQALRLLVDETESDVFKFTYEAVSDMEINVTITAVEEGFDWIYLSVVNEDGEEVNYGWIDVYCNMDGPGPDEAVG